MNFLHLSLLAGSAAIAVPIMMHLFGQSKPKEIDFPALRFVRQTAREQSRSWQLRHFLLLLLRVLLLAGLALALARPRVHSAMLGSVIGIGAVGIVALLATLVAVVAVVTRRPMRVTIVAIAIAISLWIGAGVWTVQSVRTGPQVPGADATAPIAAAIVIDNGPTMNYNAAGKTRLEQAQEFAAWILQQLPLDSQVGILSGAPVGSLALDPKTAAAQVDTVQSRGLRVDLPARIRTAVELVLASDLQRKEVYVVTDLMSASWASAQSDLEATLAEYSTEVLVQIIDVGKKDTANWHLGDVEAEFSSAPVGGVAKVSLSVTRPADSTDSSVTVELVHEPSDPGLPTIRDGELQTAAAQVVDRQVVDFGDQRTVNVEFESKKLAAGTNNFWVQIDRPDPLLLDNRRFFSIPTYSQQPTLVVSTDRAIGQLITLMVNIDGSDTDEPIAQQVPYVQLSGVQLENYAVVCLYDPPPLTEADIDKLKRHTSGGGGLLVVLGPQIEPAATSRAGFSQLLPGQLQAVERRSEATAFFDPVARSHPIFAEFGQWGNDSEWSRFPVFSNWTFQSLQDESRTLIEMSDNHNPSVLSHPLGRGQVITFTTPIPEVDTRRRELWNHLWTAEDSYAAFGLLRGAFHVLSGVGNEKAIFGAGQAIGLSNDSQRWPRRYTLYDPQGNVRRVDAADGQLVLGPSEAAGIHYLRGQRGSGPVVRSFSINTPAGDTMLERVSSTQLDEVLGEGNYRLAVEQDEVESSIGQARFGRELFPILITLVAGLFLAEQAMSNRFYSVSFGRSRGAA